MMRNIDWSAIEAAYRTTDSSLRKLPERHGVSHTGIMARAKKDRWGPSELTGNDRLASSYR
jgi:hypothetical protein